MAEELERETSVNLEKPHWVEELFPPKFRPKDILSCDESDKKQKYHLANDFYKQIYSKVILEEKTFRNVDDHDVQGGSNTKKFVNNSETEKQQNEACTSEFVKPKQGSNKEKIWSAEDIKAFKYLYEQLRSKTIRLLCILESRNLKINELKSENKNLINEIVNVKGNLSESFRENEKLKSYSKKSSEIVNALEQKLQYYEESNSELAKRKQTLQKSFDTAKQECLKYRNISEKYFNELERYKTTHKDQITNLEKVSEEKLRHAICELENDLKETKYQLETRNEEIKGLKENIRILQRHFDGIYIAADDGFDKNVEIKKGPFFLNVADIS